MQRPVVKSNHNGMNPANYLEQDNDRMVSDLTQKVSALKALTIDIGDEVRRQNKELDNMETEFDANRTVLGATMRRLGLINKSGGCTFMFYLISFAFGVFVVIYYLSRQ